MTLVIQQEEETARIPDWVRDLESFRRWAKSDEYPRQGWYAHLNGELWVDPSMERLAHNKIKTEFTIVLGTLVNRTGSGHFLGDRMLLTNVEAGLSTEPDAMFVSHAALKERRATLNDGRDALEVVGSPEMVLEVISRTSVRKDTVVLRGLYFLAGVREYWLADSRCHPSPLEILKRGPKGFVGSRKQGGWIKSALFGRSFRLSCTGDANGLPIYSLEVR